MSSSPELLEFHEKMFRESRETGRDVYGAFDDLASITKAGHFRRMEIIASLPIRDPADSVSVDFGTGPWGFARIFPALRGSRQCIGIDVSPTALQMAAETDRDLQERVSYRVSDGENIPLEDDSVDIFWGGEVVEHVRDPIVFLQEISRVCRDGADVVLTTPNREAVFYQARGLDYTIGPEHLALMNHAELLDVVGRFFDVVSCHGFLSSVSPEIDPFLTDPNKIALLQAQAQHSPELASGLIVHARNNRSKYAANRRDYRLEEQLWSDPGVVIHGRTESLELFGGVRGVLIEPGRTLNFSVSGRKIIVLLWAHDWSGEAEIVCGDRTMQVDLYSPNGGFKRVVIPDLPAGRHTVSVRRTGRKDKRSAESQVIVYKAMGYDF
jgi:ubiquinone/menaquinone biosynthesis C-methylase UbiE